MENQTENNTTEKVLHLTKNGLDKSIVRSIVIKTTETLLPIVFWIGLVVILVMACGVLNSYWSFTTNIIAFFGFLIPYSLSFIVSFYLIYLLKDIRDSLAK